MKAFSVLLVALYVSVLMQVAVGAPKARSMEECAIAADVALTSRALAVEGLERPQAQRVLDHIYKVQDTERGAQLMEAIVNAVYVLRDVSPENFATQLFRHCMRSDGDMDALIGGPQI